MILHKAVRERRSPWILNFILAVAIVFSLKIAIDQCLSAIAPLPLFRLSKIDVVGNSLIALEKILEDSKLEQGQGILYIDLKDVADRVSKNPIVKKAVVSRRLPDRIVIKIVERKPVALIYLDRLYAMDRDRVLLPLVDPVMTPSLPILTGVSLNSYVVGRTVASGDLSRAVEFLTEMDRLCSRLVERVSEINLSRPGEITLYLFPGSIKVRMRNEDFVEQILSLDAILQQLKVEKSHSRYIDLRFKGQIIVK